MEESYRLEGAEVPLGYVAEKEDIADFMVSLLGPASRYVTGAVTPSPAAPTADTARCCPRTMKRENYNG